MICCFITGVSIYTCIRYVHAVYALFGWQGQVTYNSPYTVHYTPTQYNTQYYTRFRLKISVYASPTCLPVSARYGMIFGSNDE